MQPAALFGQPWLVFAAYLPSVFHEDNEDNAR